MKKNLLRKKEFTDEKEHLETKETLEEKKNSEEDKISQSIVKEKLANLEKDGSVMKIFEENNCSVSLSNYKEIVMKIFTLSFCPVDTCCVANALIKFCWAVRKSVLVAKLIPVLISVKNRSNSLSSMLTCRLKLKNIKCIFENEIVYAFAWLLLYIINCGC